VKARRRGSRSASEELGLMDTFLSLPASRRWSLSQIAKPVGAAAEVLERLARWLEPRAVFANERIMEVPFVMSRLPRSGRILDIGCTSSPLALQLACLGYDVTAVDLRDYGFEHPRLRFVKGDIRVSEVSSAAHDCAILVSVLEHMGLESYGGAKGSRDREFLDATVKLVRPGGRVLVTVPFGAGADCGWYRVYDRQSLEVLLNGLQVEEELFGRRTGPFTWELCKQDSLEHVSSERHPMNGVALLTLSI
jgi:SAM-dependent methyltransferase